MKRQIITLFIIALCIALHAQASAKRALVIGISQYPSYSTPGLSWPAIHGANDARLLGHTLQAQGFDVSMLTDRQATAAAIRRALTQLADATGKGDLVVVHFSGHGQPYEDTSGDEDDGWDESIVPYDAGARYVAGVYEGGCHITDDELNTAISRIRRRAGTGGFVYVILDACHIGGASRGREDDEEQVPVRGSGIGFSPHARRYAPPIDTRPVIAIPRGRGMADACYLEACRAYQTNCEIRMDGRYYGALSWYANDVLRRTTLSASLAWTDDVKRLMSGDRRLIRQNIVIEKCTR